MHLKNIKKNGFCKSPSVTHNRKSLKDLGESFVRQWDKVDYIKNCISRTMYFITSFGNSYIYSHSVQHSFKLTSSLHQQLNCHSPFQLMKFLFLVSIPIAMGTVLMGWDLHHREASAFESAVFNALNQNFFALAICVFIIGYFYKCNSK